MSTSVQSTPEEMSLETPTPEQTSVMSEDESSENQDSGQNSEENRGVSLDESQGPL